MVPCRVGVQKRAATLNFPRDFRKTPPRRLVEGGNYRDLCHTGAGAIAKTFARILVEYFEPGVPLATPGPPKEHENRVDGCRAVPKCICLRFLMGFVGFWGARGRPLSSLSFCVGYVFGTFVATFCGHGFLGGF